ncbi:hypothetical protein ACRTDR_19320, partial [Shewanella algae]
MSKEDELNKKYRALPRGARWHLKLDAHGRAYFIGRQQTLATIWGSGGSPHNSGLPEVLTSLRNSPQAQRKCDSLIEYSGRRLTSLP